MIIIFLLLFLDRLVGMQAQLSDLTVNSVCTYFSIHNHKIQFSTIMSQICTTSTPIKMCVYRVYFLGEYAMHYNMG